MIKFVKILVATVFGLSLSALAQTTPASTSAAVPNAPSAASAAPATNGTKIGTINIEAAIFSSNEGRRDMDELTKKLDPKQVSLKNSSDEIESLKKQLSTQGDKMNDDAKATLVKQIESKQKLFERSVQDAREEAQGQQGEIMQRILSKMAPVIMKYASDNGYRRPARHFPSLAAGSRHSGRSRPRRHATDGRGLQPQVGRTRAAAALVQPNPQRALPSRQPRRQRSPPRLLQPSRQRRLRPSSSDTARINIVPKGRVHDAAFFFTVLYRPPSSPWLKDRFARRIKSNRAGVCSNTGPSGGCHVQYFGEQLGPLCSPGMVGGRIVWFSSPGIELVAGNSTDLGSGTAAHSVAASLAGTCGAAFSPIARAGARAFFSRVGEQLAQSPSHPVGPISRLYFASCYR